MLFEAFLTLTVFKVFQLLFRRSANSNLGADGRLKLQVAKTLQETYGGQIYQALRIPDTGQQGYHDIDVLLLTHREMYVVTVENMSGAIRVGNYGTWLQTSTDCIDKKHPNAVIELREKATVLAAYIARRGVMLPDSFIKQKVILTNPSCSPEQNILLQPEVLSYDQWELIDKKVSGKRLFRWIGKIFNGSNNLEFADGLHMQLHFILSTAPTWDRLELLGGGIIVGEFLRFQGEREDLETLKVIKRSKISRLEAIRHASLFTFLGIENKAEEVRIVCTLRDYRQVASQQNMIEIQVGPGLKVVFQVKGSNKPQNFKITDLESISLRA